MLRPLLILTVFMLIAVGGADDDANLASIRDFAAQGGLAERQEGDGPLRLLLFGDHAASAGPTMLKHGLAALALVDTWTGGQHLFMPATPTEADTPWLVLLPDDQTVFALVDHQRAKGLIAENSGGQDLAKTVPGWHTGSIAVRSMASLTKGRLQVHYAAYSAACLIIDRFYGGSQQAPSWIREGFASEVQRVQFQYVGMTTISYELSERASGDSWLREAGRVLSDKVKGVKPMSAADALRGGLDAIPFTTYRQYSNIFAFLRDSSMARKDAKGPENCLGKIIAATRDGAASEDAVHTAFGVKDPRLTAMWYAWAAKQR